MIKLLIAALAILVPALVLAGPAHFYDQPDTTYATNVVIDIIEHAGGIWFATGDGVNFSFDNGETWLLYNTSNGLVGNDISAMYSGGGRLWISSNHIGTVAGGEEVFSDGMSYTDDNGLNWVTPDWDDTTLYPKYMTGPFRTIYDISGASGFRGENWLFATAFAGAVLCSNDNGETWKRLFATRDDSLNFEDSYRGLDTLWWRNRAFSVVTDTSHGDSLYVWVGTAGGILQYVYLVPRDKFYARRVQEVAICESCSGSGNNYAWFGGVNGISGGHTSGGTFWTRFFLDDFIPGGAWQTTALQEFGGVLFAGLSDSASDESQGLWVSTDQGDTYSPVSLDSVTGANRIVRDFAAVNDRLYLAADQAGLWVSEDTGATWARLYLDSSATSLTNVRNITHSVEALGDTLFVGTDSGLTTLFFDASGSIDSARHYVPDTDSSSLGVYQIKLQLFTDSVSLVNDSFAVWTINRPVNVTDTPSVSVSFDRAETWRYYRRGGTTYDVTPVNVPKDRVKNVFFVGPNGVQFVSMGIDPDYVENAIIADANDTTLLLSTDTVYSVVTKGDTIIFGGNRGAAISVNRGTTYRIYGANLDPLKADLAIAYTVNSTINVDSTGATAGLIGNFIPALGIRYLTPDSAQIIASCRPTTSGGNGVSIGRVVEVRDTLDVLIGYKYRWDVVYLKNFAWNVESFGDTLLMATDDGLILGWDLLDPAMRQFDTLAFRNAEGKDLILPGTPVYATRIAGENLWVGTDDGTVRIAVDDLEDQRLFIRTDVSDEVYAFPVPFSPNRDDPVRFHFEVPTSGSVTLEIFDFAMNLVATPINGVDFEAGTYPPGPSGDQRPYWNGRNDRGDVVAVGVYYFKLTFANGDYSWGKLAVVP
ncbi:MAG: hypothetical protein IPH75_02060 [bacterium]|nr:hypothetical protein [bacterium]